MSTEEQKQYWRARNSTPEYKEKMKKYNSRKRPDHAAWRRDNPDKYAAQQRRQRQAKRELLERIKMEHGCALCGYATHPRALVFHHNGEKAHAIADAYGSLGREKLALELEECVVLCANCHQVVHAPLPVMP